MHLTFVSLMNGSADMARTIVRSAIPKPTERLRAIDLCCNQASIVGPLQFHDITYVDIEPQPSLPVKQFIQADVREPHWIFTQKFDAAFCIDGIEHLRRIDGMRLLQRMESMAPMQLIFTPLSAFGDFNDKSTNPHIHRSLWQPWDFAGWTKVVFPAWHALWNIGAFFAWRGGHPEALKRIERSGMKLDPL